MADHSWALPVRIVTATLALACMAAVVAAVVMMALHKLGQEGSSGTVMGNVLAAPLIFVFYAGPPLLAMGMASRSRSMLGALVALALAAAIAGLLIALGAAPWNYRHWRGGDAEMTLTIGWIFGVWPVTAGAWTLWMVINRWARPLEG